eukprot:CAMPEP_0113888722 /NCGR_PEP_ID=MMETSP0780_2-20120614/13042_1 /TAXON_ID=652834 /ORGANISM="Palpitomonas bilix" /LENGTH=534 /DNA_ID=CAMNT_0000877627 /DNA_START=12 /DNA_END=1616 /DNA_ORIENTATION=+ /assembly_acc=CAM_ASM_000599
MAVKSAKAASKGNGETYSKDSRKEDVRTGNFLAAKAVSEAVRTSLGPRGMDKMIQSEDGEVLITNDGATIMKQMKLEHPAARMMVELSKSQDIEAGDGTTSVVVVAGALLNAARIMVEKGIHPTSVSEAFQVAHDEAIKVLEGMAVELKLSDRDSMLKAVTTSLSSKMVAQNSALLSPVAVDAVMNVIDPATATNVDLRDIRVVKKLGGTVDDTELVEGLVFTQGALKGSNGPTRVENAKIALIQFCLSPPKTDMESSLFISDHSAMDRNLKEEKRYIIDLIQKVKKTGANVLLIQKSILKDAVSDLALHYLSKLKVMVVKDVERNDISFIAKTLGCRPIASPEGLTPSKLAEASLVEEVSGSTGGRVVKVTGIKNKHNTVTVLCRASNQLMLDEAERSIHDALCVIRSLVKKKYFLPGGAAPEMEIATTLAKKAKTIEGHTGYCVRAFAEALEVVPATLAENAGLNAIKIVTELRRRHNEGESYAGVNVKRGNISNILDENVLQPLLVTSSALGLATEFVRMMLKIDDMVPTR